MGLPSGHEPQAAWEAPDGAEAGRKQPGEGEGLVDVKREEGALGGTQNSCLSGQ